MHLPVRRRSMRRAVPRHRQSSQDRDAGERRPLEELERGAAAGREVSNESSSPARFDREQRCPRRRRRRTRRAPATALATPRVPAENGSSSNTPIGPFHRIVLAPARLGRTPPRSGARCRALQPRGICPRRRRSARRTSALTSGAATTSWGSSIERRRPRPPRRRGPRRTRSALDEAVADLSPSRRDQRERHRAADQQRVDAIDERADHAELVADLGATEHRDVRPVGVGEQAAEARRPPAAADGRRRRVGRMRASARAGPTTLACARCAAPNASST